MNEIKRQLDKKMGSTKERTERIMMNVEQKKRTAPIKKRSSLIYYVTFASFAVILGLVFMLTPFQTNNTVTAPTPNIGTLEETLIEDDILDLKSFFRQDGDVAHFLGDFNEFANFTETTNWLNNEYVQLLTDNGAIIKRQIYKVTADKIELVLEDMPDNIIDNLSIDELKMLKPISTLLTTPIKNGTAVENKRITYPVELKTPYKSFNDVIQVTIEEKTSTIDFYYAQNFGLIGKVTTFEDGYQITSLLASMNVEPTIDEKAELQVFNTTTNQVETLPFRLFTRFDPLFIYKPVIDSAKITYELIHKTDDVELGIVEIDSSQDFTTTVIVRRGDTIEAIGASTSTAVDWQYSPNKQFIAFRYSDKNEIKGETLTFDTLHVINLTEMRFSTLSTNQNISMYSHPIVSYKWLDNETIEYLIPDVDIRDTDVLLQWQKSDEKPTKPIIQTIEVE